MQTKKLFFIILTVVLAGVFVATLTTCKEKSEDPAPVSTLPTVTTETITGIGQTSATGGGNVTSAGSSSVTARGVCWSTSSNPTISDLQTADGTGMGKFTSNLTGLMANTSYYVRAYATNSAGTVYGNQVSFTTSGSVSLPTVTTESITNINPTNASGGGNVTSQGSSNVTDRGVCWSTSSTPTIFDAHTFDGGGTGSFISNLIGLTPNTPYYVRAYATNGSGTAYGNQISFTTVSGSPFGEPCPGIPTITDPRDGQVYPTVQIGSQCWLQKNMNYETGNSWCYDNITSNCSTYGRLYDWSTALGACPSGWHLPSDAEWTVLTTFLGGESNAGGKMKEAGYAHWKTPNTGATNESGFTALPGGYRNYNGTFYYLRDHALFWSSTESSSTDAWYRSLRYDIRDVFRNRNGGIKADGYSVRCLKD